MNIKRAGVIGVAGLTTAAVGAWTFGAFDTTDEPAAVAAPAAATAVAPRPAAPPAAPPAAAPVAPAVKPAPVKIVPKGKRVATPAKKVQQHKPRVHKAKTRPAKVYRKASTVTVAPR